MDRYLVISSDTHAGPPTEAYRDYVDPQHREAFDRDLETAMALRSVILASASSPHTHCTTCGSRCAVAAWNPAVSVLNDFV